MLFHSGPFFALFAATFLVYWWLESQRARKVWLLLASVAFYVHWNPWLVLLVLFTAIFDYWMARWIEVARSNAARRSLLTASITASLGLLAYFKYTNFLVEVAWDAFGGGADHPVYSIVLPLGISFYTFETISYVVDVYRRRIPAEKSVLDYSLFLLFFPHLIAGPIVRPGYFLPQLRRRRRFDWSRMEIGVRIFMLGLIKKAVVADQLVQVVDPVFASPADFGSSAIWAAVLCYAIQIYCDFSGYTDMAIGCAHMLGLKLPTNFNMPYFSLNVAEFWRRWHITLSTWLRDYLYIPLGGNRMGTAMTYRNLLLTMLLGGLWHGAAWTFVIWGLYHGLLLAVHRALPWPAWTGHPALRPVRVASTFLLVCVGWVFFRAQSFGDAGLVLTRMFVPTAGLDLEPQVMALVVLILATVFAAHLVGTFVDLERLARRLPAPVIGAATAALFLFAHLFAPDSGGAFIYFQF